MKTIGAILIFRFLCINDSRSVQCGTVERGVSQQLNERSPGHCPKSTVWTFMSISVFLQVKLMRQCPPRDEA